MGFSKNKFNVPLTKKNSREEGFSYNAKNKTQAKNVGTIFNAMKAKTVSGYMLDVDREHPVPRDMKEDVKEGIHEYRINRAEETFAQTVNDHKGEAKKHIDSYLEEAELAQARGEQTVEEFFQEMQEETAELVQSYAYKEPVKEKDGQTHATISDITDAKSLKAALVEGHDTRYEELEIEEPEQEIAQARGR